IGPGSATRRFGGVIARSNLTKDRTKETKRVSQSQQPTEVQQKHEQTIADNVGDMVALESHIEEALDRQLAEVHGDPDARAAVQNFPDMVKEHPDAPVAMQT